MFITGSAPLAASAAGAGGGAGAGADGSETPRAHAPEKKPSETLELAELTLRAQKAFAACQRVFILAASDVEGYDETCFNERCEKAKKCAQEADEKGCPEAPLILAQISPKEEYKQSLKAFKRGNKKAASKLVYACKDHPEIAKNEAVTDHFYEAIEALRKLHPEEALRAISNDFEQRKDEAKAAELLNHIYTAGCKVQETFHTQKDKIKHSKPVALLNFSFSSAQTYKALTDEKEREEEMQCFNLLLRRTREEAAEGSMAKEVSARILEIESDEERATELAALDMKALYIDHARRTRVH